jgi:hypothetical protein
MRASFFDEPLQCQGTLTGSPLPYLTPLYFTRANTATRARLYVRRATPEDCESDTTPARRTWRKRDKNSGAVSALSDEVLCFAVIGVGLVSDLARHGARNGAGITGGQPGFRFGGTLMNTSPPFPLGFGVRNLTSRLTVSRRLARAPAAGLSATTVPIPLFPPGTTRANRTQRPAPSMRAAAFGQDRPTTSGTVTVARAATVTVRVIVRVCGKTRDPRNAPPASAIKTAMMALRGTGTLTVNGARNCR